VKPPPVRQLERLPNGTGIMLDDVAAGVLALALAHIALLFF
jgi:phosphatidylglycerophosphatase A